MGSGQGVGPGLPESGQRPVRRTKFLIGYGPGFFPECVARVPVSLWGSGG